MAAPDIYVDNYYDPTSFNILGDEGCNVAFSMLSYDMNSTAAFDPIFLPSDAKSALKADSKLQVDGMYNGIGTDGGFLTSPLSSISGLQDSTNLLSPIDPALTDLSPISSGLSTPSTTSDENMVDGMTRFTLENNADTPLIAEFSHAHSSASSAAPRASTVIQPRANTGLGVGGLDMMDYAHPNLRIYGMPVNGSKEKKGSSSIKNSNCGFLPYPEHIPTMTLGRGKKNVRDVGPLDLPTATTSPKPVSRQRIPTNNNLINPLPDIILSPTSNHTHGGSQMSKTSKKNKKSLSVKTNVPLTPPKRTSSLAALQPATPVSAHLGSFDPFAAPSQVPFNTPVAPVPSPYENPMPFSFHQLYDLGLVEGGALDFGGPLLEDKTGVQIFTEADLADTFHNGKNTLSLPTATTDEFSFSVSSLPTPALVGSSVMSSPASVFCPSPPAVISPITQYFDGGYGLDTKQGQYTSFGSALGNLQDPFTLSPRRPANIRSASQPPLLSESTNRLLEEIEMMSQAGSSVEINQSPSFNPHHAFLAMDPYSKNVQQQPQLRHHHSMPKLSRKRSRLEMEEENSDEHSDFDDGDDSDYTPGSMNHPLDQPFTKKQRMVSAPIVQPSRRLKPGPKPKTNGLNCGGRSLSVGPDPSEHIEHAMLGFPFEDRTTQELFEPQSDDDEQTQGSSTLPKSVILSLYSVLPGSTQIRGGKKYVCLIEGCGRTFPRKSAIESHIQTHLEDKPYVCSESDWYVIEKFAQNNCFLIPSQSRSLCTAT